MKRYIAYFRYVLLHKWYVLKCGRKYGCSLWRALLHDLSKFRPDEFIAYARCFYKPDGTKQYRSGADFNVAWLKHIHRNPHHHQYWVLRGDDSSTKILPMPDAYVREMVADWAGAGKAISGEDSPNDWYHKNKDKMYLNPVTAAAVVELLLE